MHFKSMVALAALALLTAPANASDVKTKMFGYIEGYYENVDDAPERSASTATSEGTVSDVHQPGEFDTPNITFMMKSSFNDNFSAFLNLSGGGGGNVDVRNAWVENKIFGDLLKFRIGKMYRPFGIYNEILDAVPTYMGIEPPEWLDGDHLLVTRTTNFMLHGEWAMSGGNLRYALTTGNDERVSEEVPIGGDIRYTFFGSGWDLMLGSSFYYSGGPAKPNTALGSGSPSGGVANWMIEDRYNVNSLYAELNRGGFKLQSGYFKASHEAIRDGAAISAAFPNAANPNDEQIQRICGGDCSAVGNTQANYDITTWYVRAGYSMMSGAGEFLPYVQADFYENPETIQSKDFGGDNEAGLADDGKFTKYTVGTVFRPIPAAALKLDYSQHHQKIDGENTNYGEIRFSYSYIWML